MTVKNEMKEILDQLTDIFDDMITHRCNVITDSEWFEELVDKKVQERLKERCGCQKE